MRLKQTMIFTLVITLLFPTSLFAANPKAGAKCSKAGQTQLYAGKKFTCVKSGKTLVWNKGVVLPKPTASATPSPSKKSNQEQVVIKAGDQCTSAERGTTKSTNVGIYICKHDDVSAYRWFAYESPSPDASPSPSPTANSKIIDYSITRNTDDGYLNPYKGPCDKEIHIQPQWLDLVKAYDQLGDCGGIYNIAKYLLGNKKPSSSLIANYLPIDKCRITEPVNSLALRGFYSDWEPGRISWTARRKVPNSHMTVQIVPIYAEDTAKPENSPEQDYGKFTNFIKEWIDYSSETGSQVIFKYPKNYIKFEGQVSSYGIYHENRYDSPGHTKFAKDLISQVDSQIDFSGIDLIMVLVPAGTIVTNFYQGTLPEMLTNEGLVPVGTTENPYTLVGLRESKMANLIVPYWWIHELFHSGIGYVDHYGDRLFNENTEYGMGWWSHLSGWGGDLEAWEKWTLGFLADSQIHCLDTNKPNTIWLAPTSVKSLEKKLAIIPISRNKGIAIESVRAAGLYYKISAESQGVLVYEIDLTIKDHDLGLKLVLPSNRSRYTKNFFMDQATLHLGENVISNGYKISVVESGTFGDVVRVEKA